MAISYRRRLTYSRALEIVQDEEYLTEADRDIIRRRGGGQGSEVDGEALAADGCSGLL